MIFLHETLKPCLQVHSKRNKNPGSSIRGKIGFFFFLFLSEFTALAAQLKYLCLVLNTQYSPSNVSTVMWNNLFIHCEDVSLNDLIKS